MDRLELIDDIRSYANLLMSKDPNLSYNEATKKAKIAIVGYDIKIASYNKEEQKLEDDIGEQTTYKDLAAKEIHFLKAELYSEGQLKEIIIAYRMGVNLAEFINIFYTPEQIRFITLMATAKLDITPYITNLYFDPEEEMKKLEIPAGDSTPIDAAKEYKLTN
jgi:hypothetical protein